MGYTYTMYVIFLRFRFNWVSWICTMLILATLKWGAQSWKAKGGTTS